MIFLFPKCRLASLQKSPDISKPLTKTQLSRKDTSITIPCYVHHSKSKDLEQNICQGWECPRLCWRPCQNL